MPAERGGIEGGAVCLHIFNLAVYTIVFKGEEDLAPSN